MKPEISSAAKKEKEKMAEVVRLLSLEYPSAECMLAYGGEGWKLLVMGMLSAQCTDKRVNEVSVSLFARFPTPEDMALAEEDEIAEVIRPCGLYRAKAHNLSLSARRLVGVYGGKVPESMEDLLTFPGVGRKVANLLRGDLFGLPAVVCDTHCMRVCGRLGFYAETLRDPVKIEKILVRLVAPANSADLCHRLVFFGRDTCRAVSPRCEVCPLASLCRHPQIISDKKGANL